MRSGLPKIHLKILFLRTIPGLKAVEEAVGRSTEMGRPILYVPGIMDMNEVETVAGVVVLRSCCKHDSSI